MKKSVQILIISMCFLLTAAPGLRTQCRAAQLPFSGASSDPGFHIRIDGMEPQELSFEVETKGLQAWSITKDEGDFTRLTLEDAGITNELGLPELPVIRRFVQVPLGATVEVATTEGRYIEIDLAGRSLPRNVFPVQEPVEKIPGAMERASFAWERSFYRIDEYFPEELVRLSEAGTVRGKRLFLMEVTPLRYNPARGIIQGFREIRVRVCASGGDLERTMAMDARYHSHPFERTLEREILNLSAFSGDHGEALPIGYLVIAPNNLTSGLNPLLLWKFRKGFHVVLATQDDIPSWNTTGIKSYIQDAYDTWVIPPTMVLLVGDTGQLPTYTGPECGSATDLYYVTLDGSDYLPDAAVGRLPATNTSQISIMVDKILNYETLENMTYSNWYAKAVFMASLDNYSISEGTHNYVISTYFEPAGLTCDKIYARLGGGTSDIRNSLNDGRTIANYSGHGDLTYWYNPQFDQSDVRTLDNEGMTPFVISNACLTGNFSINECFGETWLRCGLQGAIAFWGASSYSYWDEDDILERRQWEGFFQDDMKAVFQNTNYAKYELYQYYGGGGLSKYYYEVYNILGDPSVNVWWHVPWDADVEHPPTMPVGPSEVQVTVNYQGSPVGDALVCLTQGTDIQAAAYTDAAGTAVLSIEVSTPDSVTVWVTSPDLIPYQGTILPVTEGPYISYFNHLVDDDTSGDSNGNDDGVLNAAERVEIPVELKNWGADDAFGVSATVTIDDEHALLIDDYETFGDIPAGVSVWSVEDYDIEVDPACPDGHVIRCDLSIEGTGKTVWESAFNLTVSAPALEIDDYDIDDAPPGGNGNGVLEPGEDGKMTITLLNDGSTDATGIVATLSLTDPYVTVTQGSATFPDIPAGSTGTGTPAFELSVSSGCPTPYRPELDLGLTGEWFEAELILELLIQDAGFTDDIESGQGDWTHYAVTPGYNDEWHISTARAHSTSHSWKCGGSGTGDYSDLDDSGLVTPVIVLPDNATLTFWHWMDAELDGGQYAWDGSIVEISTNGGDNWIQITPDGGYPYKITDNPDSPFEPDTPCFSGSHGWRQESFTLGSLEGVVQFRFRFGSDGYITEEGWYIDDVEVYGEGSVTIQLTPDSSSAARGETFGITFDIYNGAGTAKSFDVWTEVTMPNGQPYPGNPHLGPVEVTLGAGKTIHHYETFVVPVIAPLGTYAYEGLLGDYPGNVWDSDSFDVEVTE